MTRKTVKQRLEEIGALGDDIDESVHAALDMLDAERAKKAHPWSNAQLAAGMRIAELEQELEAARAERDRYLRKLERLGDCSPEVLTSNPPQVRMMKAEWDAALAREKRLREALGSLLARYVGLVASGDAGSWDPESEPEVVAARAALNTEEGTG
jgi:hypothetical protein